MLKNVFTLFFAVILLAACVGQPSPSTQEPIVVPVPVTPTPMASAQVTCDPGPITVDDPLIKDATLTVSAWQPWEVDKPIPFEPIVNGEKFIIRFDWIMGTDAVRTILDDNVVNVTLVPADIAAGLATSFITVDGSTIIYFGVVFVAHCQGDYWAYSMEYVNELVPYFITPNITGPQG